MAAARQRKPGLGAPLARTFLAVEDLEGTVPDEPAQSRTEAHELRVGGARFGGANCRDLHPQYVRWARVRQRRGRDERHPQRRRHHPLLSTSWLTQIMVVPLLGSRRSAMSLPAKRSM